MKYLALPAPSIERDQARLRHEANVWHEAQESNRKAQAALDVRIERYRQNDALINRACSPVRGDAFFDTLGFQETVVLYVFTGAPIELTRDRTLVEFKSWAGNRIYTLSDFQRCAESMIRRGYTFTPAEEGLKTNSSAPLTHPTGGAC